MGLGRLRICGLLPFKQLRADAVKGRGRRTFYAFLGGVAESCKSETVAYERSPDQTLISSEGLMSQAKCQSVIKPYGVPDYLGWIAISGINIGILHAQIIACF